MRVLADYAADLGRARPGGKLAPATAARRLSAVRALLRATLGRGHVPDVPLATRRGRRLPDVPKEAEVEQVLAAPQRAASRSRSGTAHCSSSCTPPGCGARRR